MREIEVKAVEEGQRLDRFLMRYMSEGTSGFFYKMLRKKNIVLNGKKASGSERLAAGDKIKFFLSDETIEKFRGNKNAGNDDRVAIDRNNDKFFCNNRQNNFLNKLEIIYEDEDILAVNKPVGVLSQKAAKDDISLVEYINEYIHSEYIRSEYINYGDIRSENIQSDYNMEVSDIFRLGICNRLDRNTSGIVVAGKSVKGLQWMNKIFRERDVKKYYLCIVRGKVLSESRIEGYLEKNHSHNRVEVYREEREGTVRIATEYKPLQYGELDGKEYTLLMVHLITGKSHQIRAHLKSIGNPIIGDAKYGYKDVYNIFNKRFHLRHQLLHAWRLEFGSCDWLPEKYHGMVVTAKLPKEFKTIMEGIGMDCDF